jgi:hypothetical protein
VSINIIVAIAGICLIDLCYIFVQGLFVIALVQVMHEKGTTAPYAVCAKVHSIEGSFMYNPMNVSSD